ncbi:MAG: hypothetical protein Kow0013_18310 [Pararhodobacter sp.]
MTFAQILRLPRTQIAHHRGTFLAALLLIAAAVVYPSDTDSYRYEGAQDALIQGVEHYGRHVNTVLALAVPIVLRDWVGLKQLAVATVAGIVATHGPKRLLNDVWIGDTRLGQRPRGPDSNHNMPSGHSALASAVIWFLGRRYSWWWALITVPITLLTMYARVMQNAHTISAVIAGCLIGLLVTALFVTHRRAARPSGPLG